MTALVFDALFRLPFITGLLLATVLPLPGTLLMLREEWLAAFGLAHLAAAGMAIGTATLGLMRAFALVIVPAWLAFRLL